MRGTRVRRTCTNKGIRAENRKGKGYLWEMGFKNMESWKQQGSGFSEPGVGERSRWAWVGVGRGR